MSIREMVWSSLEDLHAENPDRSHFSSQEVERGAWIYHPHFDRKLAVINGFRRIFGRDPLEDLTPPSWFNRPGVECAFSELLTDGDIIRHDGAEGVQGYSNAQYRLAHIAVEASTVS